MSHRKRVPSVAFPRMPKSTERELSPATTRPVLPPVPRQTAIVAKSVSRSGRWTVVWQNWMRDEVMTFSDMSDLKMTATKWAQAFETPRIRRDALAEHGFAFDAAPPEPRSTRHAKGRAQQLAYDRWVSDLRLAVEVFMHTNQGLVAWITNQAKSGSAEILDPGGRVVVRQEKCSVYKDHWVRRSARFRPIMCLSGPW